MEPEQTPGYGQLMEQIHRLPQDDFEKLVQTLFRELNDKKPSPSTNL
jgi:hypothetical protein